MIKKLAIVALTILSLGLHANEPILLTKRNTVSLRTQVTDSSMNQLAIDLANLDALRPIPSLYPIYIVINSPGGSIFAGLNFLEFAKNYKNVHTICLFCASMAHHISQALPGKRYGTSNTIMMAHRAKGGFRGQFNDGELESQLKLVKSIVNDMEKVNASRIGISLKTYKNKVKDEYWTYGINNIKENVLDEIVNVKCSSKLVKETKTVQKRTFFGTIKYTSSSCPLLK